MKIKPALILALGLLCPAPVSADYPGLIRDLETYTPPVYYTDSLGQTPGKTIFVQDPERMPDLILSHIEKLKHELGKTIAPETRIAFLSGADRTAFLKLAKISLDTRKTSRAVKDRLRLEEIEAFAVLRNPAVLAAQKKVTAELASFDQVMALDENLKQYSAFTNDINPRAGPLKMNEAMKQKYPYPGLTSLKGGILHQAVAMAVEKMHIVQKNIITETRNAYWDMMYIERSIQITSETIDAFSRLKDVATSLYKSGKTSFQDMIKINIKMAVLKEDLVSLSSKKENIEVKLKELLDLPMTATLGKLVITRPDNRIPDTEILYPLARKNRQELKVIRHQISKVQTMVEMAATMIHEPFTLGLSFFEGEAVNSVGTGAQRPSFPEKTMAAMKNNAPAKPWYGVDDPWLGQTKQTLLGLKHTLIEQENATDRMVRDAWFTADKDKRELLLYRDRILPLSTSALDVSTREYESGSIAFSQAIDSYTDWLKVKLTMAQKQTDLGRSVATLYKIIGTRF